MKVTVEGEDRQVEGRKVAIVLSELGTEGWVQIEIDGHCYDIDYREFWNAARAVCVKQL